MALSTENMLLALKLKSDNDLPKKYIEYLYNGLIKNKEKKNITKPNKDNVDKNSDNYKIALQFINKILENIGKTKITDLTEFKDINRDDIITETNKNTFIGMQKELFKYFNKKKCGWYQRKQVQHYILTFLRKMCKELHLSFKYITKDITVNRLFKTCSLYYIE